MHVILFDIDGTLIASGGGGKLALVEALKTEFGLGEFADHIDLRGRTDRAILRDLFEHHVIDYTPESWRRLLDAYLRHLPECLARTNGKILPGINDLLINLSRREDIALGLLTGNVRAGAKIKLGHFGLYDYFRFGGFGDEHYDRDDMAREALAAVRQHCNGNLCIDRVWVIGDTPLDVQCARAIGARAVAVGTGWHSREELAATKPDLLFDDLSNAGPLLERLPAL